MECPICYQKIAPKNIFKTKCHHRFCHCCIQRWLEDHNTCPVCRKKIKNLNNNVLTFHNHNSIIQIYGVIDNTHIEINNIRYSDNIMFIHHNNGINIQLYNNIP
jgi:hypothetical protein